MCFCGCEKSLNDYITNGKNMDFEQIIEEGYSTDFDYISERKWLELCEWIKHYGPVAMGVSFGIGTLIYLLFRFEKTIQKFALFGMMIGFPISVFIVIYTVCYLYGVFFD